MLVGVILMQQSEGGGLGMGGSPTGLMSARGAADFLTRATTILAAIFISLSILHAVLAVQVNRVGTIDTSLAKKVAPAAPIPAVPTDIGAVPMGNAPPAPLAVPMANAQPKIQPQVQAQRADRTAQPERTRPIPAPRTNAAPPPVAATVPTPLAAGNSN